MKKVALITGITGQDGSYLAEFLLSKGYVVHGLIRRSSVKNTQRIEHLIKNTNIMDKTFYLHYCDLLDYSRLFEIINKINPQEVYNLAAQSDVGLSFEMPKYTSEVSTIGVINILEAIKNINPQIKFYQASTSELFGEGSEGVAQNENSKLYPKSPYAIAKLHAYWTTINYRESYGMYTVNGILFNHESPRRGEEFVTRKITLGVANILAGKQEKILLGNLNAKRDWGYAKDYVEGMWLMLQQENPEDFVLATNETHSVKEFAQIAFETAGINLKWVGEGKEEKGIDEQTGKILVEVDKKFFRPNDVRYLLGNPEKAERKLNWKRKVGFNQLVKMMVDSDIEFIKNN